MTTLMGTISKCDRALDGTLPFSPEEFSGRRDLVISEMERRGIDILLVTSPVNYYYLTGLHTGVTHYMFLLALRRNGDGFWIGRHTEMSNVKALAPYSWAKEGVSINDSENSYQRLAQLLLGVAGARASIGIDFASPMMSIADYATLREAAPEMSFIDATGIIEKLRAIKSRTEQEYLRQAGRIAGDATREALLTVQFGAKDSDLAASLISTATRLGSEPMSMGPFVTCGQHSYRAHSSWRHARIERNELINTEIAAVVSRYNTPVFRVSTIGEPSDKLKRFHEASFVGLEAGLKAFEPGMTSHQADKVVRDAIEKKGFGEFFTVRAAYSVGIGVPPSWGENNVMSIRPEDQRVLEPGMSFHLVPALYKEDLGCVCCSMPILFTDNGVERLTDIEPKLFVIEA